VECGVAAKIAETCCCENHFGNSGGIDNFEWRTKIEGSWEVLKFTRRGRKLDYGLADVEKLARRDFLDFGYPPICHRFIIAGGDFGGGDSMVVIALPLLLSRRSDTDYLWN